MPHSTFCLIFDACQAEAGPSLGAQEGTAVVHAKPAFIPLDFFQVAASIKDEQIEFSAHEMWMKIQKYLRACPRFCSSPGVLCLQKYLGRTPCCSAL